MTFSSRHIKKSSYEKVFSECGSIHGTIGEVHYLQKTQTGGIILMELSFREQYFFVHLYVCEYTRLGAAVDQQVSKIPLQ